MQRKIEYKPSKTNLSLDDISIFDVSVAPIEEQEQPSLPQLVWAEVNILALPFAVLDEREARTSSGHEIIKFDKSNGKQIVWLWRVWPDPKVGMPTMATVRVLFALMDIADETRNSSSSHPHRVEFSLSDICRRVGFAADGRHRSMIKRHIEVLVSTQCKSKGAFKDKNTKGLFLDTFKYIRQAGFAGDIDADGEPIEQNFVIFDDPVRMNLESRYVKQIDVALMRSVKSPIGQLLYTKLSNLLFEAKKLGYEYVDVDYIHLSERMGIKVYTQLFRAKAQLKQAIQELVDIYYIKQPTWNGWTIRFSADVRYEFGEHAPRSERKTAALKAKSVKQRITRLPRIERSTEPFDPLMPLCALYVQGGWKLAEPQAKRHGMSEEQLRKEASTRQLLTLD